MSSSNPPLKGWVFPTVPLQSLPVSQEAPKQRPESFCWLTQPQKEKRNTYLRDYLASRVSLWKRDLCQPRRDEPCDTRRRFEAVTLLWGEGGGGFTTLQICADARWKVLEQFRWSNKPHFSSKSKAFLWTPSKAAAFQSADYSGWTPICTIYSFTNESPRGIK